MTPRERMDSLDDGTVLQIVSYLTQELRENVPLEARGVIQSEEDGRAALAAFMVEAQQLPDDGAALGLMRKDMDAAQARSVLELLLQDPAVSAKLEDLIDNPPEESQMAAELVIASVLLTGLLISWLQTKVDFSLTREGGVTNFHIGIHKAATDPQTLRELARPLTALFNQP